MVSNLTKDFVILILYITKKDIPELTIGRNINGTKSNTRAKD
jgi:hypothetical protein